MGRHVPEAFADVGKCPVGQFPDVVLRHSQNWGNVLPNNSQKKEDVVQRHSQTWGDMVLIPNVVVRHSQTWGYMVLRHLLMCGKVLPGIPRYGAEAFHDKGKRYAEQFPDVVPTHSQKWETSCRGIPRRGEVWCLGNPTSGEMSC